MKKWQSLLFISLLCLFFSGTVAAAVSGDDTGPKILYVPDNSSTDYALDVCTSEDACSCDDQYGIMHFDEEELAAMADAYNSGVFLEDASIPEYLEDTSSKSLLDYVPYVPAERDQGNCGNCWAWAGTGVMEVAHTVNDGVYDRLSLQYLTSQYEDRYDGDWACCGGWLEDVAYFYNDYSGNGGKMITVPWSNTNASYFDGSRSCSGSTAMPIEYMSTTPAYSLSSIEEQEISTYEQTQAQAIANIKSVIDDDRAIAFSFFLPDSSAWSDFYDFWNYYNNSYYFSFDSYSGSRYYSSGGGHSVLLVGYIDYGYPDGYWICLNSWGDSTNRPDGTFLIGMYDDYSGYYTYGAASRIQSTYYQTLDVDFESTPPSADFTGTPTSGYAPLDVEFNDLSTGDPTAWNWSFGDGSWFNTTASGERNVTHTYTGEGNYTVSLTVFNDGGSDIETKTEYITVYDEPEDTVEIPLSQGWNMVSVPVDNFTLIVPSQVVSSVYEYRPATQSYAIINIQNMQPGQGYWVAATGSCNLTATGEPLTAYSTDLSRGWNMIGALNASTSFASPQTEPSGSVLGFVYSFNPPTQSYLTVYSLEPGKGYWAAATADCTLTVE